MMTDICKKWWWFVLGIWNFDDWDVFCNFGVMTWICNEQNFITSCMTNFQLFKTFLSFSLSLNGYLNELETNMINTRMLFKWIFLSFTLGWTMMWDNLENNNLNHEEIYLIPCTLISTYIHVPSSSARIYEINLRACYFLFFIKLNLNPCLKPKFLHKYPNNSLYQLFVMPWPSSNQIYHTKYLESWRTQS